MICVICQDVIQENTDASLVCGHIFHGACITNWLWTKRSCPTCRKKPTIESDVSDSESDDIEVAEIELRRIELEQQLQKNKRRRSINNVMRRKSLTQNKQVCSLKEKMQHEKNVLNTTRNQLRIINKAISANEVESRKQEANLRRLHACQLRHVRRTLKEDSKDMTSQAQSLKRQLSTSRSTLANLEDRILTFA